jgi:hypothetical protein
MGFIDFIKMLFGWHNPPPPSRPSAPFPPLLTEDERWRKALSDFGYPYDLVAGGSAEPAFQAEQRLGQQQGFTPIILVPGLWNSDPVPANERIEKARQVLAGGVTPSLGKQLLTGWFKANYESPDREPPGAELFDALRPVPPQALPSGISMVQDYDPNTRSLKPFDQVAIMRIPTAHGYEVPAYLSWSENVDAPSSLEIAAVGRYWEETHGATLVAMGPDKLEFSVTRRPGNHAEAVALLKEHVSFASETLQFDQDMLEGAAADLQASDQWFFWWD